MLDLSTNLPVYMLFLASFLAFGCDDDADMPISGCDDSSALNFNADATINDGSCAYERDLFLGLYQSVRTGCLPSDNFLQDAIVTFKIEPFANATDQVKILVGGVHSALNFVGDVSADKLIINDEVDLFESVVSDAFMFGGVPYLFPTFQLSGTLTHSDGQLTGRLTIGALNADQNNIKIFSIVCDHQLSKS